VTQGRPGASASYTIRAEPGAQETAQDFKVPHVGLGIKVLMIATGAVIAAIAMGLVRMVTARAPVRRTGR
jgi:hypothetical protein